MFEVRKIPASRRERVTKASSGFTLLELLVVVALIGILIGILLPAIAGVKIKAQVKKAETDVRSLAMACRAYHTEFGSWPIPASADQSVGGAWSSDNYLVVNLLIQQGNGKANYVESAPDQTWRDPFKSNFPYRISIDVSNNSVTVTSYGPDCDPGGGDNISVSN